MENYSPLITVLGSINMDLFAYVKQLPVQGATCLGSHFKEFTGGKGANQAVASAKLNARVAMIGCIGNDSFAERLKSTLVESHIDIRHIRTISDTSSGLASIWVDANGANSIIVIPGANGLVSEEDIDRALPTIERSQFLVAQLECPISTVAYAFAKAKHIASAQVQTILNPAPAPTSSSAKYAFQNLLQHTDIVIPNETELAALTDLPVIDLASAKNAAKKLHTMGARQILVTLGAEGSFYSSSIHQSHSIANDPAAPHLPQRTASESLTSTDTALDNSASTDVVLNDSASNDVASEDSASNDVASDDSASDKAISIIYEPACKVTAIDTTAAGDSFIGAYVTALTEGKSIREAMHFATQTAAYTVTHQGAQDAIPTRRQLTAFMETLT